MNIEKVVSKAKSYVVNQTSALNQSLVHESIKWERVSHVLEFKEAAALSDKAYETFMIAVDNESGKIMGFGKSDHDNPNPEIELIIHRKDCQNPILKSFDPVDKSLREFFNN